MPEYNLEAEIKDVLRLTDKDAFDADAPWFVRYSTWLAEIGDALQALAKTFSDDDLDSLQLPLIRAAEKVWDEVVVPYDVPNVPAFAERWVESSLRAAIPAFIGEAISRAKAVNSGDEA